MKVAILGYAGQGQSAYEYWNNSDNELTICDRDKSLEVPSGANSQLGDSYLQGLDNFDLLVRTPALHPRDIVNANPNSPNILDKVTTVTDEFFRVCPTKNIIGVTGTKGKGTTSTLIARMLETSGKRVHLGGNIGIPPLELLKNNIKPTDIVVLELANFQLIDIKHSPHIAVCLMVVPEHLDWHTDFDEYVHAKQQLFHWQQPDDIAICYAEDAVSKRIAADGKGLKLPYYGKPGAVILNNAVTIDGKVICATNELKLIGQHNWQNVCAAVTAAWQVTQDVSAIRSVLVDFSGLEHRLELVREIEGVKYYDDSFGTTPETAVVALEAFSEPKVVILGGSDKGAQYETLAKAVKNNNVREVILIGDTASAIRQALESQGITNFVEGLSSMEDIVMAARQAAQAGDVILLSTGCASFGMFKNYKDRGEQFKLAVASLA